MSRRGESSIGCNGVADLGEPAPRHARKKAGPFLILPSVLESCSNLRLKLPLDCNQSHQAGAKKQQAAWFRDGGSSLAHIQITCLLCSKRDGVITSDSAEGAISEMVGHEVGITSRIGPAKHYQIMRTRRPEVRPKLYIT